MPFAKMFVHMVSARTHFRIMSTLVTALGQVMTKNTENIDNVKCREIQIAFLKVPNI
jgi:hypothetical protein